MAEQLKWCATADTLATGRGPGCLPGVAPTGLQENLSHRTGFCLYVGYMRTIESAIGQI